MTETTITPETTPTFDAAEMEETARKFAAAWDRSAASVLSAATHARKLSESGMTQETIADTLKVAIAERQAGELGISDPHRIAAIAETVKLSVPKVSQLRSALNRCEAAGVTGKDRAGIVKALYSAATGKIKAGDLDDLVKRTAELETGRADFIVEQLAEMRTELGRKVLDSKPVKAAKAQADDADGESNSEYAVTQTINGAAAYTLADILRATEAIAKGESDANRAAIIRKVGNMIVEELAN